MDLTAVLPTFVVTLREGFEAALVVGIVLACLKVAEQTRLNRWVYAGVGAGTIASLLVGLVLASLLVGLESYPVVKESLEAGFGIVAIALLSWMLIWMTNQAKSLKSEVEGAIQTALASDKSAAWVAFTLTFIAVLREGFETVLFIVAQFEAGWKMPAVGAVAGLTLAAFLGLLLFQWGVKINIRLFFQVMGVLLLAIVGGLLVGVLSEIDKAVSFLSQIDSNYVSWCFSGASCILGSQVWDASAVLPDKQFPGIILKALFGYRQIIYFAQAVAYILFISIVGSLYFRSLNPNKHLQK